MNIDFDRLKYSLTGEYEEVMLEKQLKEKDKEIQKLNNIINELEKYYYESIENCKNGMNMLNSNSNEAKRLSTRFVVYNENLDKLKSLKEGKE